MDGDNNGFIEFDEFLRASIDKEKLLTEKNLKMAFDFFDRDKNGSISAQELKFILGDNNINIKDIVWKKMIKEIDLNEDGQISYEEFKMMMMKVINKNKKEKKISELKNNLLDVNNDDYYNKKIEKKNYSQKIQISRNINKNYNYGLNNEQMLFLNNTFPKNINIEKKTSLMMKKKFDFNQTYYNNNLNLNFNNKFHIINLKKLI